MESVEASTIDTTAAQPVEINDDSELAAIWDRVERDNGAARDDGGKFASTDKPVEGNNPPEEGGEGEAKVAAETSTQATDVPLPPTWRGQEAMWAKIPADIKADIKNHEDKLHQTLSQQGQHLATFKPVGEAINKYAEYFDGRRASHEPAKAIEYLFGLQRGMDDRPLETIMQVIDTYELRPTLAKMFGGGEGQGQGNEQLLAEISELKSTIRNLADPSKIDAQISRKFDERQQLSEVNDVISRVSKDVPLINEVSDDDLAFFVVKSRAKLGDAASADAVLRAACDMAINADPDIRAKAAALKSAVDNEPDKVAAAKRANSTNIKSTSTGKARELTEDEELGNVWDKNHKG
jgi:hypothetical protein